MFNYGEPLLTITITITIKQYIYIIIYKPKKNDMLQLDISITTIAGEQPVQQPIEP